MTSADSLIRRAREQGNPVILGTAGGLAYFKAGSSVWQTDGTSQNNMVNPMNNTRIGTSRYEISGADIDASIALTASRRTRAGAPSIAGADR